MPQDEKFGVFRVDDKGPLWQRFFGDLDEARRYAKNASELDGFEFFIYSFENSSEIARFFPLRAKREAKPMS